MRPSPKILHDAAQASHAALLDDTAAVLRLPQGRRFVRRLLDVCDVRGPVVGSESVMHYREGQRSLGRWLENSILERHSRVELAQLYEELV